MDNKKKIFNFSFRDKLTIIISVITGLSFLLIYFLSLYNINSLFKNKAEERHNIFIRSFSESFFGGIEKVHLLSEIIAKNDEIQTALKNNDIYGTYGKLADLMRDLRLEQFSVKALLFEEGIIKAVIPGEFTFAVPEDINQNIIRGLKGKFFKIIEEKLYFISLNSIYDKDSSVMGSIALVIVIDNEFLQRFKQSPEDMFFVKSNNNFIYRNDISIEDFYNTHLYSELLLDDIQKIYIIAGDDISGIRNTIKRYSFGVSTIFLIVLMSGIYISGKISSKITDPVNRLVIMSQKIADGNLDEKIEINNNDEIGVLSHTMENMRLKLKNTINELKIANRDLDRRVFELTLINELTNEMNYLQDYREVFRVILRKLVNSLNLEIGSVIIMQENTLEVLEANVRGRFVSVDNRKSEKRFKAAFTALKTGKPVIVRDVENTVLFEKRTDEHVKNIVCFPFRVKNDIRGVFNLTNRKKKWNLKSIEIAKLIIDQGIISIDNARLYEMAITDGLTGLYIHRFFQIRLSEEILRAQKNNSALSLVMFDIDHFKNFNDKYGHQTGDLVLEKVSDVIRENIRKGIDTAARYGGEEFAVIIPETDCHGAYAFAERLREKISKKELYYEDKRLFVTVSLGVASYPIHAKTKTDIICKADNALYYSKEHGRNCSTIYNEECSNG